MRWKTGKKDKRRKEQKEETNQELGIYQTPAMIQTVLGPFIKLT